MRVTEIRAVGSPLTVFRAGLRIQGETTGEQEAEKWGQTPFSWITENGVCPHFSARYLTEQGVGFQPFALGSFLKSELVINGRVKYIGSSTFVVTVST